VRLIAQEAATRVASNEIIRGVGDGDSRPRDWDYIYSAGNICLYYQTHHELPPLLLLFCIVLNFET